MTKFLMFWVPGAVIVIIAGALFPEDQQNNTGSGEISERIVREFIHGDHEEINRSSSADFVVQNAEVNAEVNVEGNDIVATISYIDQQSLKYSLNTGDDHFVIFEAQLSGEISSCSLNKKVISMNYRSDRSVRRCRLMFNAVRRCTVSFLDMFKEEDLRS